MVLGLGTGSTAAFAVAEIGALLASGKLEKIVGVPTSKRTFEQAQSLAIPLSTLDDHPHIDLAIDGADEVRLILASFSLRVYKPIKSFDDSLEIFAQNQSSACNW
jgi:ribose 5-phosphate isomerase